MRDDAWDLAGPRRRAWVALIPLILLLVGCGDPVPATRSGSQREQAPPTTAVVAESETRSAETGATLTGIVVSASDIGDRPATPLAEQLVLLLPADTAPSVLGVPADNGALRFLSTAIEERPPGLVSRRTGPDGRFTVSTRPGKYVLCLADTEGEDAGSLPLQTRGCALLTLTAEKTLEVEVSTMFGEILLTTSS